MSTTTEAIAVSRRRSFLDADDWVVRGVLVVFGVYFLVALVAPLFMMTSAARASLSEKITNATTNMRSE